jgi:hypothetical protein
MALGLPQAGQGKPFVKYDARAGRFSISDGKEQIDITQQFAAIFDMENIEVGWARFLANAAPDFVMARVGTAFPARPSDTHKSAFRLRVKMAASIGGDVREFASAAGCVNQALDALHDAYIAAPESKRGLLPVVTLAGTTAVKTNTPQGTTTNYKPNFQIVKWVPRPADLEVEADAEPPPPPVRAQPRTPEPVGVDTEF